MSSVVETTDNDKTCNQESVVFRSLDLSASLGAGFARDDSGGIMENEIIELEKLLTSHVAIAPESGGDGESEKASALKSWLLSKGFCESQFSSFNAPDSRVSSLFRPNLLLTIKGKSEKNLWICSHLDVVPEGRREDWETEPFEAVVKDGKIFGRGCEDNQQGLVSSVMAALYFLRSGEVPKRTVRLLFMADEEVGSKYGMCYLLSNADFLSLLSPEKDDFFLIPDGGDEKGETIEVAEKNILWLKFETKGKQCHGSTPNEGKNAMLAGCELALKINALEKKFNAIDDLFSPNYSTFQPTKKENNVDSVNIIPGVDVFYADCRILPCYTLDEVRSEVKKAAGEIEEKYGVKIEISETQSEQSVATKCDAPIVKALSEALKKSRGIEAKIVGIGGGTVAAAVRNKGFDAVVWSTLDEKCHQANEYAKIESIEKDAETMIELLKLD